jgi:hypothetical protein
MSAPCRSKNKFKLTAMLVGSHVFKSEYVNVFESSPVVDINYRAGDCEIIFERKFSPIILMADIVESKRAF